jgi:hypothetical protein
VLELGAGTGLTSIIMATAAKRVYSTGTKQKPVQTLLLPKFPLPSPFYVSSLDSHVIHLIKWAAHTLLLYLIA